MTAKDLVMALIEKIGASGAVGHAVEFAGSGFHALSVEGRMTICNMIVEAAPGPWSPRPTRRFLRYLSRKPRAPRAADWSRAADDLGAATADADAQYDSEITLDAQKIEPLVTWGTSPDQVVRVTGKVPDPASLPVRATARCRTGARIYGA